MQDETDYTALEYIGFNTGYRLIAQLTREVSRFNDELETIKFICTDFWTLVYKKQVDNLRTNNHGIYVVQDRAFRFLTRITPGTKQIQHAPKVKLSYLDFYYYSIIIMIYDYHSYIPCHFSSFQGVGYG